jgi:predicted nucleic acid-binding protein
MMDEYETVLSREELGIRRGERPQMLQLVRNRSHSVVPHRRLQVSPDPDDDKFLECADAARADFLITGNRKHFPAYWEKTKIVTSREFLNIIAPHLIP